MRTGSFRSLSSRIAGNALDAVFVDEIGDFLDDAVAGLLERNLVDDDPVAVPLRSSIVVFERTTIVLRPVW